MDLQFSTLLQDEVCKKIIYLRQNSIYNLFPKTPLILLNYIIELFTEDNNNVLNICKIIEEKYALDYVDNRFIYEFFKLIINYIYHYYKNYFCFEKLAEEGDNKKFIIDEFLFIHSNDEQIWVIGIINTKNFQ